MGAGKRHLTLPCEHRADVKKSQEDNQRHQQRETHPHENFHGFLIKRATHDFFQTEEDQMPPSSAGMGSRLTSPRLIEMTAMKIIASMTPRLTT